MSMRPEEGVDVDPLQQGVDVDRVDHRGHHLLHHPVEHVLREGGAVVASPQHGGRQRGHQRRRRQRQPDQAFLGGFSSGVRQEPEGSGRRSSRVESPGQAAAVDHGTRVVGERAPQEPLREAPDERRRAVDLDRARGDARSAHVS